MIVDSVGGDGRVGSLAVEGEVIPIITRAKTIAPWRTITAHEGTPP